MSPSTASPPISPRTWTLLTSKLRRSDRAAISPAELERAGGDLQRLRAAGLVQQLEEDLLVAPGCEDCCRPNWDWDSRKKEGLVGVACPNEPACWSGFKWLPRADLPEYRIDVKGVLAALRVGSRLQALTASPSPPFLAIGQAERRGKALSVVWIRRLNGAMDLAARGLRSELGDDWLVVVVSGESGPPRLLGPAVAALGLTMSSGALELAPALDVLDPGYRERAVTDPELELDFVHLVFATVPGERHVLQVNGHEVDTFENSDANFLRLLYLAAVRKKGAQRGKCHKAVLVADFGNRPKPGANDLADDALSRVRRALQGGEVPGLTAKERKALVKADKGTGKIRLAVPAENITFDDSLARLTWVGPGANTRLDGTAGSQSDKQRDGLEAAQLLLAAARRLVVPGDPNDIPPLPPR